MGEAGEREMEDGVMCWWGIIKAGDLTRKGINGREKRREEGIISIRRDRCFPARERKRERRRSSALVD